VIAEAAVPLQDEHEVVLRIEGLEKRLVSGTRSFTLSVPTFALERGKFYGLVGKSGSGKSTFLDFLALVAKPTKLDLFEITDPANPAGTVDLRRALEANDDALLSRIRHSFLGYVLQAGGLFNFLTTRQNLSLPAEIAGRTPDWAVIDAFAKQFGVYSEYDKKPSGLSGGQRQRVAILRALSLRPALVLCDEPTAAVDESMANIIVQELRELAMSLGSTIVMVSHDIDLVSSVADVIIEMHPQMLSENDVISVCRT